MAAPLITDVRLQKARALFTEPLTLTIKVDPQGCSGVIHLQLDQVFSACESAVDDEDTVPETGMSLVTVQWGTFHLALNALDGVQTLVWTVQSPQVDRFPHSGLLDTSVLLLHCRLGADAPGRSFEFCRIGYFFSTRYLGPPTALCPVVSTDDSDPLGLGCGIPDQDLSAPGEGPTEDAPLIRFRPGYVPLAELLERTIYVDQVRVTRCIPPSVGLAQLHPTVLQRASSSLSPAASSPSRPTATAATYSAWLEDYDLGPNTPTDPYSTHPPLRDEGSRAGVPASTGYLVAQGDSAYSSPSRPDAAQTSGSRHTPASPLSPQADISIFDYAVQDLFQSDEEV